MANWAVRVQSPDGVRIVRRSRTEPLAVMIAAPTTASSPGMDPAPPSSRLGRNRMTNPTNPRPMPTDPRHEKRSEGRR